MKMDSPKVSVIVPVYNAEKYLRKCLDSLLHQTLQELEIVVINDGSVDNSPEILREYVEEYPDRFLYREQKNSGQAAARNRALSLCRGEYVGFLDADDFVRETMFERMYEKARETDADYVACGYTDLTTRESGKSSYGITWHPGWQKQSGICFSERLPPLFCTYTEGAF